MDKGGYNKRNFYVRVLEVQDEYLKYANSGRTTQYIFRTFIQPRFHISRSTFYSWLAVNAKAGLARIRAEEQERAVVNGGGFAIQQRLD